MPADNSAFLPTWSWDGNILYFISSRAGSVDIWLQRLDPATKQPAGEGQLLRRFPFLRHTIQMIDPAERRLAATRDRLVFPIAENAGSIWLMEPRAEAGN